MDVLNPFFVSLNVRFCVFLAFQAFLALNSRFTKSRFFVQKTIF